MQNEELKIVIENYLYNKNKNIMLNKELIYSTAKYLQFPKYDKTKDIIFHKPVTGYPSDVVINFLPIKNMLYSGLHNNHHHYTTEYHIKYVLPTLETIFNFGYIQDDFILKENIINDINEKTNKREDFNLSYLYPIKQKKFKIQSYEYFINYDGNFDDLLYNKKVENLTWVTPYHKLFCLPHSCSRIDNLCENNGKTLLVLGDSQIIPSLSILCYYYKTVIYLDNRDKKSYYDNFLKDINADDILIEMFNAQIKYYIDFFM
jgi:hypothetical protein